MGKFGTISEEEVTETKMNDEDTAMGTEEVLSLSSLGVVAPPTTTEDVVDDDGQGGQNGCLIRRLTLT